MKNKIKGFSTTPELDKLVALVLPTTNLSFSSFVKMAITKECLRIKQELNLENNS